MDYGMTIRLQQPFSETVERVRAALKEQGFGVLTEIDVRATLQEKLGETIEDYLILGACNPPLANQALQLEPAIGLLLPCNVVVAAEGPSAARVWAIDPEPQFALVDNPDLAPVAAEVKARLRRALETLPEAAMG